MAHPNSKLPACTNCYYTFRPAQPDDFCPRCGQQNQAVPLGVVPLTEELLEGLFHFDNKVFRTLRLLLFRPGELTRLFLTGHRVPYVPPFRLYVFISFLFFFLFSLPSHPEGRASPAGQASVTKSAEPQPRQAPGSPGFTLTRAQLDSLPNTLSRAQADSVLRKRHVPVTFTTRLVVQHLPRIMHLSAAERAHQLLRAVSFMLFVLMPLAALLLQLFYWHQHCSYVSHLIFSVHLHCFLFVLLALLLGLNYLPVPADTGVVLALVLIPLYLVLALRRLYGQRWRTTLWKSALLLPSYGFLFGVGQVIALGLGLLLI